MNKYNLQKIQMQNIPDALNAISNYCKVSPILPSNTKTRRLGYLSIILDFFEESEYYPVGFFPQKIEQEVEPLNDNLLRYKNDKGVISRSKKTGTFTGTSAMPYLDLAINLSLLIEINRAYILTKQGKIYRAINRQIKADQLLPQTNNPFELNLFQKVFFFHQILVMDALYSWSLLEMINKNQVEGIDNTKSIFQQYILDELHQQLESNQLSSLNKQKVLQIQQRIRRWKKADKYLPHIVEPRINWFLDLGLLDEEVFQSKKLKFSEAGMCLFEILNQLSYNFQEKSTIIEFIIEYYFFQIMDNVYGIGGDKNSQTSFEYIIPYIEESFKHFKTMAPNSISASQAIYYSCYKSLFWNKTIIEFHQIKSFLENKAVDYSLDWFKKEHDGSLQRRR